MDGAWPAVLAAVPVALSLLGFALLRRRFVVVTVRGPSMEPVLREGDRVLVRRRRAGQLRTGDLVVFAETPTAVGTPTVGGTTTAIEPPAPDPVGGWLIKRAVAVAGDPVPHAAGPALARVPDEVVPAGHLVAIGDNAASSYDSRHYGYVTADRLLGVVLRRLSSAGSGRS